MNLRRMFFSTQQDLDQLTPSSRFSLKFMKRTNLLAIIIFVGALLIKFVIVPLVQWLVK